MLAWPSCIGLYPPRISDRPVEVQLPVATGAVTPANILEEEQPGKVRGFARTSAHTIFSRLLSADLPDDKICYTLTRTFISQSQRRRRGLQVGVSAGSCNFPTDSCTCPTEKIWMLKISILPHHFPQMGDFQFSMLCFSKKIF